MSEQNTIATIVNYKGKEINVSHTQFSADKVKTAYHQKVMFYYSGIDVVHCYKSDDLSPHLITEKICSLIDAYGSKWELRIGGDLNA